MTVSIRAAKSDDLRRILSRSPMAKNPDAENNLFTSYKMSAHCWVGIADDELKCVWGLIPSSLLSNKAYMWFLGTIDLKENLFAFVRHSQRAVEEMLQVYPLIVGYHCLDEPDNKRWLQWLGAEFGQPEGRNLPFQIRAK